MQMKMQQLSTLYRHLQSVQIAVLLSVILRDTLRTHAVRQDVAHAEKKENIGRLKDLARLAM